MPRALTIAFVLVLLGLGGLAAIGVGAGGGKAGEAQREEAGGEEPEAGGDESLTAFVRENPAAARSRQPVAVIREKLDDGSEASSGPAQQQVDARAWPRAYVSDADAKAARSAYLAKPARLTRASLRPGVAATAQRLGLAASWQELGPVTGQVPGPVTYTGAPTQVAGRTTALLISPTCGRPGQGCRLWVGAAGGGVWRTEDATAAKPAWTPVNAGIGSLAIGSLAADPSDPTGQIIYAGTGEPNASGDAEAGLGVFKSVDGGDHWSPLPGSTTGVATDRAVSAIVVDPTNPNHLWIGTGVARHGSSSTDGGARTPPNAPRLGVYETVDGGASFAPTTYITTGDGDLDPQAARDGRDAFNGGVTKMQLDPNDPGELYVAAFGYGVRRWDTTDRAARPELVFATAYPFGSVDPTVRQDGRGDRSDFFLVADGARTRMYVGDTSDDHAYGVLWRADDVAAPASSLVRPGGASTNAANLAPAWRRLSDATLAKSPTTINPGHMSYGFCSSQCTYDAVVAGDPNDPDVIYLGGAMSFDDLFGSATVPAKRTNGRAVLRSTDAGVTFSDMTNDAQEPQQTGMHPDQHALVLNPSRPGQFFAGSDGGVVRSSGSYVDDSARCARRASLPPLDLALCRQALGSVPTRLDAINDGLATLQFQGVAFNPMAPASDLIGGTQDNGTWGFSGSPTWAASIGGDGGNAAVAADGSYRVHTFTGATQDISYRPNDPSAWLYIAQPMDQSGEAFSFYVPEVADPRAPRTIFTAGEHVWRTTNAGGDRATLEARCRETALDPRGTTCGDWVALGGTAGRIGSRDNYVVSLERAASDGGTLWAGRRRGGVLVSKNADAAGAGSVAFTDVTASSPDRFVSGITVDPTDANHAWVSFSGYSQYTSPGRERGHVFEVRYDPAAKRATWTDRSYDIGPSPITDVARDDATGDLYAATDFGVLRLASGATSWTEAATGMPLVAVYGLSLSTPGGVLYAATHGRGVFRVDLRQTGPGGGEDTGGGTPPAPATPPPPGAAGPPATATTPPPTTTTPSPATTGPPSTRPPAGGQVKGIVVTRLRLDRLHVTSRRISRGRRSVAVTFRASAPGSVGLRLSTGRRTLARRTVKVRAGTVTIRATVARRTIGRRTRWTAELSAAGSPQRVTFRP